MNTLDINAFVELCIWHAKANGIELTHLKLQKVLYYLQAWGLAYANAPLFNNEPQAWVNGPVYREVYERFRNQRDEPIVRGGAICEEDAAGLAQALQSIDLGQKADGLIEAILEEYMPKSAGELVYKTHRERPWKEARAGLGTFETGTNPITHEAMRSYYSGLVAKNEPAQV